jgi:DNA-binding transcriptional ArsR family regulator
MPVLFRRDVPIRTIVAIEAGHARALQAPIRLAMLDLLSCRPMSVEELGEELPSHGFRKATNTLRHHLEILVRSGLVELALLEQTRGAVLKYFAAAARPLHYHIPETAEADMEDLTRRLAPVVRTALRSLARTEASRVSRVARSVRKCPRCPSDHYAEFVLLAALHRASVSYLRDADGSAGGKAKRSPPARPRAG